MDGYWERITRERSVTRRRFLAGTGAGLASAALLAACGGSSSKGSSPASSSAASSGSAAPSSQLVGNKGEYSPSDGTPTPGGRLAFTATSNASYNSLADWSEGNYLAGSLVYDRPVTTRPDTRRFILEAMASIEQPEPLKVVMKLKPGMTYSDTPPVSGRAVKASDIDATQKFIASLTNAYDKTFVNNYLDSAEVTDDRTITFKLKKPLFYLYGMGFLGNGTGQPIIPVETLNADMKTSKPIGSGSYLLDSAQVGVGAVYKKNPKFREADKVLIAEREYKVINDPAVLEAAIRTGQVDWSSSTGATIAASIEKDNPGKKIVYRLPGIADGAFRFNTTKPDAPWRDVRIREAIWRLTNRAQLLELGQNKNGVVVDALMCAALPQYFPDPKLIQPYFQEDVAKANQLLKAANWNPDREVVLLISAANSDPMIVFQQQLARGGIKSRIENYTGLANFFQKIGDGNWDAFSDSTPGSGDPYIQIRNQHSKSWSDVYKGFAIMDADIDAMIEKSEQTLDVNENNKLVKDIQVEAMKKFTSSMTLYTLNTIWAIQPKVQNWELSVTTPNPHRDAWLKA